MFKLLKFKRLEYIFIITDYPLSHNAKVEYNITKFPVENGMKNLVANSPYNMINNDKY